MRRSAALLILVISVVACRSTPDSEGEATVVQLAQSHYNVALAVARGVSDTFFVETADEISRSYARLADAGAAGEVGELVRSTFSADTDVSVADLITALAVSNRAATAGADVQAFENATLDRILETGSARDHSGLFASIVTAPEPNTDALRSVLDSVYTLPFGDERTMALVEIARIVAGLENTSGLNAIVQQTIPSLGTTADPVRRLAAYAATARHLSALDGSNDISPYVERGTAAVFDVGELRVPARDLHIFLQALEDLVIVGSAPEAEMILERTQPLRSRAEGLLVLADFFPRRAYGERALLAALGVEDSVTQIALLQRVAVSFARGGHRDDTLRAVDALERLDEDFGAWPAGFLALVMVSERTEVERYLRTSAYWPDLERASRILAAAIDTGNAALAEQIYTYLRTTGVAAPQGSYVLQLARMGKTRDVAAYLDEVPYASYEGGDRLLAETLRALPADATLENGEKERLSRAFESVRAVR